MPKALHLRFPWRALLSCEKASMPMPTLQKRKGCCTQSGNLANAVVQGALERNELLPPPDWVNRCVQNPKFDLVVSGINRGENCGLHIIYSGTVGAAREAACKVRRAQTERHARAVE